MDPTEVTSESDSPDSSWTKQPGAALPATPKRFFKKHKREAKEDFWLGLLNYGAAALEDGRSPAELLMGRELRTLLPDFTAIVHNETKGRQLAPLQQGDIVRILNNGRWEREAQVQGSVAPRSCTVLTEDGRILRRNRQHLQKTPEGFSISINDSDSEDGNNDCLPPSIGSQPPSPPEPPRKPGVASPTNLTLAGRQSKRPRRLPQRLGYTQGFQQAELI
ncbi:hypothetical protein HPB47_012123 [Ixodes persulcatus]|uniref:Uncharacterized protein n=1 Tax=Ixodes persulcatus TaxID=34615 RepID=A0AC60NUF9_IXOPE|nr:hypothetical protein HPB47_012123 [Ixodes persulcatus]